MGGSGLSEYIVSKYAYWIYLMFGKKVRKNKIRL